MWQTSFNAKTFFFFYYGIIIIGEIYYEIFLLGTFSITKQSQKPYKNGTFQNFFYGTSFLKKIFYYGCFLFQKLLIHIFSELLEKIFYYKLLYYGTFWVPIVYYKTFQFRNFFNTELFHYRMFYCVIRLFVKLLYREAFRNFLLRKLLLMRKHFFYYEIIFIVELLRSSFCGTLLRKFSVVKFLYF